MDKDTKKNIKDSAGNIGISIKDTSVPISFMKTNKLITALYIVTDIIEKDEPLRNKLRTLGTEIVSDIHHAPANACIKIDQIMSFLDIASAINIISEMNANILRKEFLGLNQSIKEFTGKIQNPNRKIDLSEFFQAELPSGRKYDSIGHRIPTRIGVQKGSTLMKALSDRTNLLSNTDSVKGKNNFDTLRKERRDNIISIIKSNGGNSTIKDIKVKINNGQNATLHCSEKTLQRELMSMIKEGVLNKTGEKRWSRYFVKN